MSCDRLLLKLLAFATKHSETPSRKETARALEAPARRPDRLRPRTASSSSSATSRDEEADEDLFTEEMLEDVEHSHRDEYKVDRNPQRDLRRPRPDRRVPRRTRQVQAQARRQAQGPAQAAQDRSGPQEAQGADLHRVRRHGPLPAKQLEAAGITGVEQIDSASKATAARSSGVSPPTTTARPAPNSPRRRKTEIRVLISTDVLSEGLNLQDATRLINYDLHWNPVRLMQRIGRVDRRLNPEVEERHRRRPSRPESALRGKVAYWNFLPPDELERTAEPLHGKVTQKTLRISKTFGIEGKKLLRPEDDYEALQEFNHAYEGTTTPTEEMHLEFQQLLNDDPELADRLDALPGRVFSGKRAPKDARHAPSSSATRCQRPGVEETRLGRRRRLGPRSRIDGLVPLRPGHRAIFEDPAQIIDTIRCTPATPRHRSVADETLSGIRAKIEKHIKNTYLKRVNAPVGVKPIMKCWMEISRG